jgi:hypothetical protein
LQGRGSPQSRAGLRPAAACPARRVGATHSQPQAEGVEDRRGWEERGERRDRQRRVVGLQAARRRRAGCAGEAEDAAHILVVPADHESAEVQRARGKCVDEHRGRRAAPLDGDPTRVERGERTKAGLDGRAQDGKELGDPQLEARDAGKHRRDRHAHGLRERVHGRPLGEPRRGHQPERREHTGRVWGDLPKGLVQRRGRLDQLGAGLQPEDEPSHVREDGRREVRGRECTGLARAVELPDGEGLVQDLPGGVEPRVADESAGHECAPGCLGGAFRTCMDDGVNDVLGQWAGPRNVQSGKVVRG